MIKYDKYKPSGVEWIGEIPEHWEAIRLRYVAGVNPSTKIAVKNVNKEVLFLPMDKVGENWQIDISEKRLLSDVIKGFTYFQKNDLIIAKITPCFENGKGGILDITDEFGFGSTEFHVIRGKGNISQRFLSYIIRSNSFMQLGEAFMIGSAGQKRVPTEFVENYILSLPPISEQQAIAAYLDEKCGAIDAVIEHKDRLLELYAEKRQAIINRAVTCGIDPSAPMRDSGIPWLGSIPAHWDVKRLKYICKIFGRIGFRGYTTFDLVEQGKGAITLSPSNMKDCMMDYSSCSYISWEKYEESPEIKIYNDDVLFVKTGSTYGKTSLVQNLPEKATINPQIIVFKQIEVNTKFFCYCMQTSYVKLQVECSVVGGTIPTISQEKIYSYELVIPDIAEQTSIVGYIEAKCGTIDKITEKLRKQIELYKEYRTALIANAVTGKIKVTE